ncbi:MAG: hypothetical protein KME49_27760 [Brasilonema octagenarum HA4186-MV1]|jgi:hypothetical protein|uniref:Uncharacterized protein n=2 Tax=Brasilonema TaxID=383614 RepID=A0A856MLW6_9CYAN|nr:MULTISPECIES: hypothetical protein [Brasilonema]MBP5971685.1 hypothetical protein [Brasilonema sp. CT11]MBW4629203.1 hypothetical protein [Brasilonema octagenarum HA4186-MV1]QDL18047.1 hypothetical protein DP113_30750 [Brasilonema octagenarum UFV-E1]NMF65269.1 hypothetical protein [Brasilonema octagenarum UFV-OR1]QDL11668.1 hypothetical protein DP114_30615 [Brasilonema sennae CENA114]
MKCVQTKRENSDNKIGKLLQDLSENHQKAMTDASELLKSTSHFLDASVCTSDNSGGATVESNHQAIQDGLVQLLSLLP